MMKKNDLVLFRIESERKKNWKENAVKEKCHYPNSLSMQLKRECCQVRKVESENQFNLSYWDLALNQLTGKETKVKYQLFSRTRKGGWVVVQSPILGTTILFQD